MTTDPDDWIIGIAVVAMFGAGTVVAALMLARPASLVISSEGLRECGLRARRWDWRDVSNFRVWTYRTNRGITFDNIKRKAGLVRSLNLALGAGSDSLTNLWAVPPQELADLLNEAKRRWG